MRWVKWLIAVLVCLLVATPALAGKTRRKRKATVRICSVETSKGKRKRVCKRVPKLQGRLATAAEIRKEPLPKPSGDIELFVPNLQEGVTVNIYDASGNLDEAAIAQLDRAFRCSRSGEQRAVDPRLFEMLSRFYDHFGRRRIELVSGFRGLERESSRHHHASSMDLRIPGVELRELHAFAQTMDVGVNGVGIYPTSGFIHFDFRAPGERSYRWTDYSGPGSGKRKKKASKKPAVKRIQPSKRPIS